MALSLFVGESAEIHAIIDPSDASNQDVAWTSTNNDVATVRGGVVSAVAPGMAIITATSSNGLTATCPVRVEAQQQDESTLTVGTLNTSNGRESNYAARCRTGMLDLGEYVVDVTPASYVKYAVYCYDANEAFIGWTNWVTNGSYQVLNGTKYIRILFGYTDNRNIGDSELAELESMFTIRELDKLIPGTLSTSNGQEANYPTRCHTEMYDLQECSVTVTPESGVKYAVFSYGETGAYLGWSNWLTTGDYQVKNGARYIRILFGYTDNRNIGDAELVELAGMVSVGDAVIEVVSISLNASALELLVGELTEIGVEVEPEDASDKEIIWSSSDEDVVTVSDGVVFAVAPGTAVITAETSNGLTATCPVRVISQQQAAIMMTVGTLNTSNGGEANYASRCRTGMLDISQYIVDVTPASYAKYAVFCYDANENFLGWTSWVSGTYQAKSGTQYIRILFGYTDNRNIAQEDLYDFEGMISISEPEELIPGTISTSNGLENNYPGRCHTVMYDLTECSVTVTPVSGMKYAVFCYDANEAYLGWSNWLATSEYQTKNGTRFIKILFKYDDNRNMGATELAELARLVKVGPPCFKVTYDAGRGMFPATKQKTYVVTAEPGPYYLDNYGEDMVPVLDGYEFHGWLYQGKFVEQVNLTSNIVLTPMWVQVFDLVFDANGGHFPDATTQAVTTKTIKVGPGTHRLDNVMNEPIPDPIRNGYIFVGWLYNNKIVKKVKITDASVTVVAQWETAYQVTYDADGGTMSWWDKQQDEEIMSAQYVTTVPAGPYYVYDAPRPWRTDATTNEYDEFVCWTQTVNGKDVRVDDCINLTANLTLKASYAKWLRITYDANGGKFDEDGSTTKEDGARSGPFKSYWVTDGNGRNVSRDNYSFLGWSTQANATTGDNNFDAFLTEDTTYYAVWSEKPVITYDANGGYFYHKDVYDQNGQQVFDDHGNPMKEAVTIETRGMELGEGKVDGFGVNFDGPYQFIGWSTSAKATTATYQPGDPITITGSITLYAVFKQMPTIIYNANGGGWGHYEPIPSATEGGDATEQFVIDDYFKMHWDNAGFYYYVGCDSPERPGYEFLGWYTTSGENGLKADDDELILAEGATYYYYAHWAKRVTVTYETNEPNTGWGWWDYQYNENGVKSIVFEQTSFTRDTIAGSDYKIDGWRPDAADSPAKFLGYTTNPKGTEVEYEVDDPIVLTDDITLYAVWVQNPTIHYVCDEKDAGWYGDWDDIDGDGEEECVFETQERLDWRNLGEHEYYVYYVGFEAPERPGYEFDHWVDDQGVNADDRALTLHDGDVYTFHATWRKIVTVTYTTNIGGWGWFDNDAPEGEKYEYVEFNNYDRNWGDVWTGEYHVDGWTPNCCDGPYEFVGYATDEDATEATLQPGQKITLTDDTTFFAIWKQLPTITYYGNGGGWGEYDEDEDMYEESIKLDWRTPGHYYHVRYEQPYRENYDFDGWVDAQDVPKDDVALLLADGDEYTFYAKWIPHVTIVYYANGGEFDGWEPNEGESSIRHIRHERGGEYWLDGWHPNREGYDFGGWSLTPENQQKVTEPYNLAQDTMFYAIWDELLTVTYDANGGVWYDWEEDPTTGQYQTITLTQQQQTDVHRGRYDVGYGEWPEREGYEFIGWAPTFDSQEASEWWTTEINGNTTFYAIWEKLMVVTYDAGDGYFWYDEQNKQYETTWTQYAKRNEIIRINDWAEGEPEREGYRFDGWLYNGDALRWVRASQDITFTVDWVKTYEVQLVANGGYFNSFDEYYYEGSFDTWQDGEDYVFYKQQCDDGEGYDFFNGGFPVPQRDGYTFIGWSYPSDNDENLVYAENIVINGADVELFAQWEPIPDYEPEMISANDYQ
ncbi:MAG: InlB B-repeat-containing protein [Lachnospiraceae bacterium]|nr:InlB B-repeat-containing protein [Lachnospiraceae bacterium]